MHLVAAISAHGYGHLAQTAPVLEALQHRLPDLRLTVLCGLPRTVLENRLAPPFVHLPDAGDFGLIMKDAFTVDVAASHQAYLDFHADWDERVAGEARRLAALKPDGVLANVSYLALAAARKAGIPAVGLGSLHWAAISRPYLAGLPGFARVLSQMEEAYGYAQAFLRLTPGMELTAVPRLISVGPVASPSHSRRERLPPGRLVLVAMGGVGHRLPETLPQIPDVTWLAPRDACFARPDVLALEETGLSVSELIASVDAVLTKAGYGTFVEAAACGTPLVFVRRPDWPEEPALATWHARVSRSRAIDRADFERGTFGPALAELIAAPRPAPVAASGAEEAARWLAAWLKGKDA